MNMQTMASIPKRLVTEDVLRAYQAWLQDEEKSQNTQQKYLRDLRTYARFLDGQEASRERTAAFRQALVCQGYNNASVNSMLSSLNSFFRYCGWEDCRAHSLRIQRQFFSREERELSRAEYQRLIRAAQRQKDARLGLILQTICATGIRVSELPYITVESVRTGTAVVVLKGKTRTIFLPKKLQNTLTAYLRARGMKKGSVFVTKTGKPLCRSNIWRQMKALCQVAQVDPRKVFPHNLRHLFARTFYAMAQDLSKLADILGHSSLDTTRIYIQSSGREHRRLLEQMNLCTWKEINTT